MIVNQQSLRGIYVGFNTLFNKAFEEVAPLYTEVATVTPSTTDSETYAWLGDIPGMREWIGEREIQNLERLHHQEQGLRAHRRRRPQRDRGRQDRPL